MNKIHVAVLAGLVFSLIALAVVPASAGYAGGNDGFDQCGDCNYSNCYQYDNCENSTDCNYGDCENCYKYENCEDGQCDGGYQYANGGNRMKHQTNSASEDCQNLNHSWHRGSHQTH